MKTGLITFHFAHHYGAQLQAYALMTAAEKAENGNKCEIIDYRLPHTTMTNKLFEKNNSLRSVLRNSHTALNYSALSRRYNRFNNFVDDKMNLSKQSFTKFEELSSYKFDYNAFICGSDQIWNPFIFEKKRFDPSFFIAFAKEKKLCAYAPSFGTPEIPAEMHNELIGYLQSFSHISVREKQGQKIIKEVAGLDVPVVLDPTLLLTGEEWGKIASPSQQGENYILCYFVSEPKHLAPQVEAAKKHFNMECIQLAGARRKLDGVKKVILDAGPCEFLSLFKNASFVITNSFHGAVFSLLFKKPFISGVSTAEIENPEKSRVGSLLSSLGQTERLSASSSQKISFEIDYTETDKLLAKEREFSFKYLCNALRG